MILYAIKIGNKYFKEYVYASKNTKGRYPGHGQLDNNFQEGDIIDLVLTKTPERAETKRSMAGSIATIYTIDKMKNRSIKIIPVQE